MSLSSHRSRLAALHQDLCVKWEETKESWQDAKAMEFERHHLQPLQAGVETALEVIEELDKLIARIKHDCE